LGIGYAVWYAAISTTTRCRATSGVLNPSVLR
jgi:hypothetical protein